MRLCWAAAMASASGHAPAAEGAAPVAPESAAGSEDVIVIGKSYGQNVGKTVTPLKDVPNTVTVLDQEQLQAQNLFTLEDALTATPGITVTGVGSEDPSYMSRGFAINNYLVDGTPTMAFMFPATVPDLFLYDRIEVLRGPAGLFSGSGNPAGSINLVRKRPLDTLRLTASMAAGSYNNYRGQIDLSVPLGDGAGVRVGAMAQDQDQFFDVAHRNRLGAFAVATARIGARTTITVGGNYELFKPAIQTGLPGIRGGADGSEGRLLDVRRSTYLGADWNRFRAQAGSGFVEIAHRISDRWTLRATGLVSQIDRDDVYSYIGNGSVTATDGVTSHIAYRGDNYLQTRAFDVSGVGSFPLFGREQTLILGTDYQANSQSSAYTRLSRYAKIDVYHPVSPAEPPLNPYGPLPPFVGPYGPVTQVYGGSRTEVEQFGMYGQMRLSPLAGLTLIGGGRMTWWDTRSLTTLPTRGRWSGYSIDGRFTPYAGAVWDVTRDLNVYASYADSFLPQTSAIPRFDGKPILPQIGSQYEIGSKLALFRNRLLLSLAAYQVTQRNRLFTDQNVPDVVFQLGKVRSRGIEAEASGQILPGWRINGGYAYNNNRYLADSIAEYEGISFVPVIPAHQIKLFTNYAPDGGPLARVSLGGGVTWFSATYGGVPALFNANGTVRALSTIVRQGSYALLDLRAGYRLTEQVSFSVNFNNVLDRTYYARISSTGRGNFYGSPRTILATVRFSYQ